ncbi:MAG TPA: phosphoribosylamine--glycine ligase [Candidatus Thermoplasmatota archaeon]|nr:phosphoribosylamine--glycine ligase [Candidatus Thermoplasmatota archaeon]
MTRVLLVGGGAREHAIADALVRSGAELYAMLPNRNPGILALAKGHVLAKDTDAEAAASAARRFAVEYAVVGPDAALAAGVTDALQAAGVKVASPTRRAAEVEWSKAFMRDLLERHKVPGRVRYRTFDAIDGVRAYVEEVGAVAVKPTGLTGGKGVKVTGDHLRSVDEAIEYARECLAGGKLIVEEKVEGEEFSLQAFCDGTTLAPMPAVQDHKRAFEGDQGPNTGGMGSYSGEGGLLPFLRKDEYEQGVLILQRILDAMRAEGRPFVGTIYGQFMLSREGPRVIEINARFGDPEAMNVLALLESSYLDAVKAMAEGRIAHAKVAFSRDATVCKYVVPEGYGVKSMADQPLAVDEEAIRRDGARAYYAAVNQTGGEVGRRVEATTTTSRSVGVIARAPTLAEANARVDQALRHVTGPHLYHRRDIGTPALLQRRVDVMRRVRGD